LVNVSWWFFLAKDHGSQLLDLQLHIVDSFLLFRNHEFQGGNFFLERSIFVSQMPYLEPLVSVKSLEIAELDEAFFDFILRQFHTSILPFLMEFFLSISIEIIHTGVRGYRTWG
jgi:hypothetical protein